MHASKGVSPLIATVILVGIVLGLSAVFINFYGPFQKARQSELEESGSVEVECSFASLEFTKDDVLYNLTGTTDHVNVTVDNTGTINLYDFEVTAWVSDVSYTYSPTTATKKTKTSPLEPGARVVLVANVTDDLSGTLESVRVVAKNCPRTAKKVDI